MYILAVLLAGCVWYYTHHAGIGAPHPPHPHLLPNHPPPYHSIRHTIILEDPFDDPPELAEHIPPQSPEPVFAAEPGRLEEDWVAPEETRDADEVEASNRANEAANRAVVLEMIGDLPDADVKPPSNMLFVCKLNPVTTDEDLEIVFSRFGHVTSCDVIKDWKTGGIYLCIFV